MERVQPSYLSARSRLASLSRRVRVAQCASHHRIVRSLRIGLLSALFGMLPGCGEAPAGPLDSWIPAPHPAPYLTLEWSLALPSGAEGSPSLCDLRGDGKLEVIAPLSSATSSQDETGALVADALSGEPRLHLVGGGSHPYGSVACAARPDDSARDLLIGGRAGDIFVVDGRDGSLRYRLAERHPELLPQHRYPYAFASPVALSPDGNLAATAWIDESDLIPLGRLILFEPSSGTLLQVFDAPEGALAYASPSIHKEDAERLIIVFPTGGEISPGHLHILVWDGESLTVRASLDSSCELGGFVASPHLADLDGDGLPEIVAGDYCGGVHIISLEGELRFMSKVKGTTNANPVTGDFDGDGYLDILAIGVDHNPSYEQAGFSFRSEIAAFSGLDGKELFRFTHEMPILASPAILDLNGDAFDDFILVSGDLREPETHQRRSGIHLYDGRTGQLLSEYLDYRSLSTPVIDDVDGDGIPDLFLMQEIGMETYGARLSRFAIRGVPPFDAERSFSGFRGHPRMSGSR